MNYYLEKADNNKNKYSVQFLNKTTKRINTINFGNINYDDYLTTNDDEKKRLYRLRHQNDNINDLNYPGAWSWHLLWSRKSIEDSIKDMEKRFKIDIKY
tara:strand:- start:169 stop:465 length:297 start_codon:yes stop_codon:yes gene_type:complete